MSFDWNIKITDIAIVLATILGPIFAVQAQKYLEKGREINQRRAFIFRTLMATRATNLSPAHVEALNAIPIEFYGDAKALRVIIDKWKTYLNHLTKNDASTPAWGDKRIELFVELLHSMATFLGYEFNTVEITNEIYRPVGHAGIETDQEIIRRGLAQLFSGKLALPMEVKSFPSDPSALKEHEELRQLMLRWLGGASTVAVEIKPTEDSEIKKSPN